MTNELMRSAEQCKAPFVHEQAFSGSKAVSASATAAVRGHAADSSISSAAQPKRCVGTQVSTEMAVLTFEKIFLEARDLQACLLWASHILCGVFEPSTLSSRNRGSYFRVGACRLPLQI